MRKSFVCSFIILIFVFLLSASGCSSSGTKSEEPPVSGDSWSRMDPTFDSNSDDEETIQQYIGNDDNYIVQFTR